MIRIFAIWVVRAYVKLFYSHKVYGLENIRRGGGILAANHASFLDPPIVGVSYPGEVHFLARDTLFRFKPFGWLIRSLNTHPVSKGKGNAAIFKKSCELILSGKKVVVFPEGTRTNDGELGSAQAGVAMLVMRTKCIVIPIYIYGTYEIWNSKRKWPSLRGSTACVFGSALDFSALEGGDKKEIQAQISTRIMEAIGELKKWYLEGAQGTPP